MAVKSPAVKRREAREEIIRIANTNRDFRFAKRYSMRSIQQAVHKVRARGLCMTKKGQALLAQAGFNPHSPNAKPSGRKPVRAKFPGTKIGGK